MTRVERVRSARAAWLGRYPSSSIVPKTLRKVSGLSRWGALAALETVWRDTPARLATISMVGRFFTAPPALPSFPLLAGGPPPVACPLVVCLLMVCLMAVSPLVAFERSKMLRHEYERSSRL